LEEEEKAGRFHYLAQSGCTCVEGMDDAEDFVMTRYVDAGSGISEKGKSKMHFTLLVSQLSTDPATNIFLP